MARRSVQRRQEFSFPPGGSPAARGVEAPERRGLLPAVANAMAPRAGEEDFRWLQASRLGSPESGSGTPSPQLSASHDEHHRLYPASAGSSPSRVQAIAGYRREMLDLVRGLPEAAYELSLRDIVESRPSPLPPPPPPPPPHAASVQGQEDDEPKKLIAGAAMDDEEAKKQSGGGGGKKQGKVRKQRTMGRTRSRSMERSVSLDTGLLIKLFLPLSVGRRKKVSPKPFAAAAAKDGKKKKKKEKKEGKKEEEEWWKKSDFSEEGSSSRTSSSGSSNSSASRNGNGNGGSNPKAPARSRSRKRIGCYGFFRAHKSKNGVIQE